MLTNEAHRWGGARNGRTIKHKMNSCIVMQKGLERENANIASAFRKPSSYHSNKDRNSAKMAICLILTNDVKIVLVVTH